MTEDRKPEPNLTAAAARARDAREARQAAALRANLRRRKDQARGRDAQEDAGDGKDGVISGAHSVYPDISE